jgi:T5SS/PEP-CTERM-associated repeat protein/autotransporter-associated beta strand protein
MVGNHLPFDGTRMPHAKDGLSLAVALLAASVVPAHAQSEWIGSTSNWFDFANWSAGRPSQTTDGIIDTVTPNSTVIGSAGAAAKTLEIGQSGTGMLAIQSGGTLADSFGAIGNFASGVGTVTVSGAGSNWSNAGSVVVGGQGTGTLVIRDGGTVTSGGGSIGLTSGSTGTVTVTGAGSTWTNGPSGGLNIGSFGTGSLTIAEGAKLLNIAFVTPANIGNSAGSRGTVLVTGSGSLWTNDFGLNIGNRGNGMLTIADGAIVGDGILQEGIIAGPVVIANSAGSIGTLNIGAGAGDPAAAPGTLRVQRVGFGDGTGTINFNHTSADYVFAPAISGSGTVNVLAGTTIFTGANTYTGATAVAAGSLRAGAADAFSAASFHTVAPGATLDTGGFNQRVAA